jgi:putative ABC transport system substrate-binding protein
LNLDRRRVVSALAALGCLAALSQAHSQAQGRTWRIGFLAARARDATFESDIGGPFLQGMRELGYLEGKNVQYEWRFADGKYERLESLAAELVKSKVDLIVASTTPATRAAQNVTRSIPIVMVSVADPVGTGLVASLARPGSNTTGVANFFGESSKKQLDLLVAMIPKLSRVGVLLNPDNQTTEAIYKSLQEASQRFRLNLIPVPARSAAELERAFSVMTQERIQGFVLIADGFFSQQRLQIVQLAAKARIPGIYPMQQFSEVGGLMSYGANMAAINRRAAFYVDKIFKGAKPAEMPVEQPAEIKLVINLQASKALGITFPSEVRLRADRVIE